MSIESVMLHNHFILCHPLLLLPSVFQSFPVSQLFTSGGQSIGASASVLPMNIQGWFPLGLTGLISLLSKGLSRMFSSTIVWKHQFFAAQPSLWSSCHIHTWLLEKPLSADLCYYRLWWAKWCLCFLICYLGSSSEKTMAPHSSTLAWKIPWTEEPGELQSMGLLSWTRLSDFTFTFHFHALEKEMETHSSVLAWRIPGTGESGGLLSMGSQRVRHDWSDLAAAAFPIERLFHGGKTFMIKHFLIS